MNFLVKMKLSKDFFMPVDFNIEILISFSNKIGIVKSKKKL